MSRAARGISVLEVVITAALLITVTAFIVPQFGSDGDEPARRTLVAAYDAATQLRDQEQGWSTDTDALRARTARVTWGVTSSASPDEVAMSVSGTSGEFVALAVYDGSGECWMLRSDDSSGVPEATWAVRAVASAATCTAQAAEADARPSTAAPGRGGDANTPIELG